MNKTILVYAHWDSMPQPEQVGRLEVDLVRGAEAYRFTYAESWLSSPFTTQIDPQLQLFSGNQFNDDPRNFRAFLDSCPDRWGRLLMQRREAVLARQEERRLVKLNESDYLLGVHDSQRMGGLRFKSSEDGAFLDNSEYFTAPPLSSLRELEYAVNQIEKNTDLDNPDYIKWLFMLVSPGSSLGGARPKASVADGDNLWLAKFPSRYDDYDIGAWEYLAYLMALDAGVHMAPCRIQRFNNPHHTFLTQRFDRTGKTRHHFSSAMTQLGYYDGDTGASYLELAQFLIEQGANTKADLAQLWRRIVFYMLVFNSDDHLRNHGFILAEGCAGWLLSPAYDININLGATGLHLNVDDNSNELNLDLALEVASYFQLSNSQAKQILLEVKAVTSKWQDYAKKIGINRSDQQMLENVFGFF
ncbi:type II toxin-antitoxin system HipA family toxin [Marinospirillum insulare]|uniref:Toxin HipA n=1 Tax=Marinospirillum insulare TaxID=217169 RepID=A0ABQ5ZUL6_9GAMM|nr:HipA domain-containing protein [Marinospirillum insulare]GLR63880.1 toxin HipA [Marinospirillum insulare]